MRLLTTTFGAGLCLAIVGSAGGQTVKGVSDNRVGSVVAAITPQSINSASYVVTPRTQFVPIDFNQAVVDGAAYASLSSQSQWIGLVPGGTSAGFTATGSLGVSLGAVLGTAIASDSFDVQFEVSGLGASETVDFYFFGSFENVFSTGKVTFVGNGVNVTHEGDTAWNQIVSVGNGTHTLSMDAMSSLVGFGPDSGQLNYFVYLDRVLQPGDMCDEAIPIVPGSTIVSTVGMRGQSELPASCDEGYGVTVFHDAFFTYEATANGFAMVHTCGPETNFDTRLAVYEGPCDNLTLVGCNDDSAQCGIGSSLTFPTVCGERYVIRLGSYSDISGTSRLTVLQSGTCASPCPADVDGDGAVGAPDVAILLGQWGGAGAADLDGSSAVDSTDLAILLGGWGACP